MAGALLAPPVGLAASGGTALTPGGGSTGSVRGGVSGSGVGLGNATVTATGNGLTLTTRASALLRHQMTFSGTAGSSAAGQTVEIERSGHQTNWQWLPSVQATVAGDGSFSAVWPANHIGRFSFRARIAAGRSARLASALPTLTATVYRAAIATQYGPGFYGQRTACGAKLRPSTLGVANRTLKCGTLVGLYYHGRTLVVAVIDRGPYANHADWDLTEATGRVLGISGTAQIGAVSLPAQPR